VTDVNEAAEQPQEPQAADEPARRVVMVEFVGAPPHGNSLHRKRILTRSEVKGAWGLTISKDLEWTRENAFRMVVEGNERALTPEVIDRLSEDPKFKLHYETVQAPAEDEDE
jgi:hypothetical protein